MRREFDCSASTLGKTRYRLPATECHDRLAATLDDLSSEAFVPIEKKLSYDDRRLRDGRRLHTSADAMVGRHELTVRPGGVACCGSCKRLCAARLAPMSSGVHAADLGQISI